MSTLVIQPSFRALGQMQVKWQTFEKSENKRQVHPSLTTIHLSLIVRFFKAGQWALAFFGGTCTLGLSLI